MIGLPSLQALDEAQAQRIWLSAEATDMRCGFDRLAERVRAVIGEDPLLCGGPRYVALNRLAQEISSLGSYLADTYYPSSAILLSID